MAPTSGSFEQWVATGCSRIGELEIRRSEDGSFDLLHWQDSASVNLEKFAGPVAARVIGKNDDGGKYRPLKSAPNLRHGWILRVVGIKQLRLALDFFYPAAIGMWEAHEHGKLLPVCFRQTAERQSGMYEIVKCISNQQADALAGKFCSSQGGCLKTILWRLDEDTFITTLPREKFLASPRVAGAVPLLCAEACNLFVAAARSVVKKARATP